MENKPKFGELICPKCEERQFSIGDNQYLELFGECWSCDRKKWQQGELSLEEFEKREEAALG